MDSRKSVIWAGLLAALALLDTCSAFTRALEKNRLDGHDTHDIEMYIEQKIHYIHAKIDLGPTVSGLLLLEKFVYKLEKGSADTLSSSLSKQINKRIDRIVIKLKRISGKPYLAGREKRAIEFLGDLISDIFGNPGPTDWKKVNSNLIALQTALRRVSDNTSENHKDIDTNRNTIEKHNKLLSSLSAPIARDQNDLTNVGKELENLRIFIEITTFADTLESQVDYLIEIKMDSVKGYCSDRAIDKDFLVENLQGLESNKAGLGPVYGSWEWREYYRHEFCTIALDNDAIWVSVRIPLVKKSEKLVRVIPTPTIGQILSHVSSYGLSTVLFREKENDKFHLLTQASLDLCNVVGNIRTCGVRDVRFGIAHPVIVPVEFARNKLLLVGVNASLQMMAKCPEGISEHSIVTDSVLTVPNNCSYVSGAFSIDTRESDVEVTKELNILQIDKMEIIPVHNPSLNATDTKIETIASKVNDRLFENNRREINRLLENIDTKHEGLSSAYSQEKWLFVGVVASLIICMVMYKFVRYCKNKQRPATERNEFELKVVHDIVKTDLEQPQQLEQLHRQQQQQQQQQQQHQQPNQQTPHSTNDEQDRDISVSHTYERKKAAEHDYQEVANFNSPRECSQFYKKK